MSSYSKERKSQIIRQLLPPINSSVSELSEKECIPKGTLYNWRLKSQLMGGGMVAEEKKSPTKWSSEQKLSVVAITYSMTNEELNVYCRENGLYPDQIKEWKTACLYGQEQAEANQKIKAAESTAQSKKIKLLQKELNRKEKALAEAAALLTLGKKFDAHWLGEEES